MNCPALSDCLRSFVALLVVCGPNCSALVHGAPVSLQQPTATFSQTYVANFFVGDAIDGSSAGQSGWAISNGPNGPYNPEVAVFETATDVGFGAGSLFTFTLAQVGYPGHLLGHVRLSYTTDDRSLFADGLATGGDVTANWTVFDIQSAISDDSTVLVEQLDHSVQAVSGYSVSSLASYVLTAQTTATGITGLRLEALDAGAGGPGIFGNFVLTEFSVDIDSAPNAVPEASTWAAGLGLLALVGWSWSRQSGRS